MAKTIKKTKVPQDELELAAAIAAAEANDLAWCRGADYRDDYGHESASSKYAAACCARGALRLAGMKTHLRRFENVTIGNDWDDRYYHDDIDHGESLGWAFRQAMVYK